MELCLGIRAIEMFCEADDDDGVSGDIEELGKLLSRELDELFSKESVGGGVGIRGVVLDSWKKN